MENEICYTGGIYDESTGLYYLNARYYAPQDGRFLSQDTCRGEAGEPSTWNLYAYCADNPVGYVDPSGHATEVAGLVGLVVVGVVAVLLYYTIERTIKFSISVWNSMPHDYYQGRKIV